MNPSSDRKRENGNPPPKVNAPALDPTAPTSNWTKKNLEVKRYAALALATIGVNGGDVVPSLLQALKDKHPDVREYAAWVLGIMGEKSVTAIPDLISTLQDDNWNVRIKAAWALGVMGKRELAIPVLTEALQHKDKNVVESAKEALFHIGIRDK